MALSPNESAVSNESNPRKWIPVLAAAAAVAIFAAEVVAALPDEFIELFGPHIP